MAREGPPPHLLHHQQQQEVVAEAAAAAATCRHTVRQCMAFMEHTISTSADARRKADNGCSAATSNQQASDVLHFTGI